MSALATSEASLKLIADGNRDLVGIRTDRGGVGTGLSDTASQALFGFLFKAELPAMGRPCSETTKGGLRLEAGADDKVFLLNRASEAACRPLEQAVGGAQ